MFFELSGSVSFEVYDLPELSNKGEVLEASIWPATSLWVACLKNLTCFLNCNSKLARCNNLSVTY